MKIRAILPLLQVFSASSLHWGDNRNSQKCKAEKQPLSQGHKWTGNKTPSQLFRSSFLLDTARLTQGLCDTALYIWEWVLEHCWIIKDPTGIPFSFGAPFFLHTPNHAGWIHGTAPSHTRMPWIPTFQGDCPKFQGERGKPVIDFSHISYRFLHSYILHSMERSCAARLWHQKGSFWNICVHVNLMLPAWFPINT